MALFSITFVVDSAQLARVEAGNAAILAAIVALGVNLNLTRTEIMNDLTQLQATMDALAAKATETNATLAGLAQAVIDLKNSGDVQAGIDALAAQAQGILDGLTTAEDAADDQLPAA